MRPGSGRNRARTIPDKSCRTAVDCKAPLDEQALDIALLPGPDLDHQLAARREQARRIGGDRPIGRKPVRAAVERMRRIMVAHLAARALRCRRLAM